MQPSHQRFRHRADAGRVLADLLKGRRFTDPVVLALPRGGVPVGFEVAVRLKAPLDVFIARKIGAPGRRELGVGAIAEGGTVVQNTAVLQAFGVSADQFTAAAASEQVELDRRVTHYRAGRPLPALSGRDVLLVDDGVATGVTAEAALRALREHSPRRLILAAPVCAAQTAIRLRTVTDEVVCPLMPTDLSNVGGWYDDFTQTSDAEVLDLLAKAAPPH